MFEDVKAHLVGVCVCTCFCLSLNWGHPHHVFLTCRSLVPVRHSQLSLLSAKGVVHLLVGLFCSEMVCIPLDVPHAPRGLTMFPIFFYYKQCCDENSWR